MNASTSILTIMKYNLGKIPHDGGEISAPYLDVPVEGCVEVRSVG